MLAGTVYFYDDEEKVILEMDLEAYEDLDHDAFMKVVDETGAAKVTLKAFYHNHHSGTESVIYTKEKGEEP